MPDRDDEPRRSASAEAAALRRAEREPDSGQDEPHHDEGDEKPPARKRGGRPSASAEAAALRWHDEHPDD
jgi:hypothetical protein